MGSALLHYPLFQAFDDNGDPLAGGLLYTYVAGTSTNKATYADKGLTSANANPVVLDPRGEAQIYFTGTIKLVLNDSADALVWTEDDIEGISQSHGVYYADASEADQGAAGDGNSIKDLIDSIGAKSATIVLAHTGTGNTTPYVFSNDETIPSNIFLQIEPGALHTPDAGVTLTVYRPENIIASPHQQIVDTANNSTDPLAFTNAGTVYPEWWGVDETDDQLQINLADNSLSSGGEVILAGKIYDVQNTADAYAVLLSSNIWLHGVPGITTLKCGDITQAIQLDGVSNVRISDLIVDGNKDNFATGHGIRGIGVLDEITIERVEIKETGGYGIGFQEGTFTNITFRDLDIHDIDNDGIDFKNRNDINSNIVLDNIRITDFGEDNALTDQAGIDMRGPAKMTNIKISSYGDIKGFTGIRFAAGELLGANGLGGLYSSLTNFKLVCNSTVNATYGIALNTRFVQISNGYIEGAQVGIEIGDLKNVITNVVAQDCKYGLNIKDEGGAGDFNLITNFLVQGAIDDGIVIQTDNNTLVNCSSIGAADDGIRIVGATNTTIIGGLVSGSGGNEVDDAGTNTIIKGLSGWKTKNRGTGTILNGNTSIAVVHGMGRDVDIEHVTITPAESTATSKSNWVTGIGATEFTVNVEADPGEDWDFGWQVDMEL